MQLPRNKFMSSLLKLLWCLLVMVGGFEGAKAQNAIPKAGKKQIALPENQPYRFSKEDFKFSDADINDKLVSVRIAMTPRMVYFHYQYFGDIDDYLIFADVQDYEFATLYLDSDKNGVVTPVDEVSNGDILSVNELDHLLLVPETGASGALLDDVWIYDPDDPIGHYEFNIEFNVSDGKDFSYYSGSMDNGLDGRFRFNIEPPVANIQNTGITFTTDLGAITGIEELLKGRFSYYPNPAQSTLNVNVQYGGQGTEQLLLSDLSGKIHIRRQLQPSVQAHRIDISNMAPGVYVLTYRTPQGSLHQKLVVR